MKKHIFKLKQNRLDGLILQIHNTLSEQHGDSKRIRFINAVFNEMNTLLCVVDNTGNVYIIDFENQKLWQLPYIGSCVFTAFCTYKPHEVILGFGNGILKLVNFESGSVCGELVGHKTSVQEISFTDHGRFCLTSASDEAIIWDLNYNTQAHVLSMKTDISLKKVMFMPVSNNILACFQDDAIHIWKFGTFDCIKQIVPETWKSHHLKCITFTKDGRAMVIGGYSPNLVLFCLDTWVVLKVINLISPITGIKSIKFVPQIFDGGANKILAVLANDCTVHFLNIDLSTFSKRKISVEGVSKFNVSPNGKYIACLLDSGEVNIYLSQKVLEEYKSSTTVNTERASAAGDAMVGHGQVKTSTKSKFLIGVQKQIKNTLDIAKLKPLLKEFGSYPDTYRAVIWKSILQVPENYDSYQSLTNKKLHHSYSKLEESFPLENKSLLQNFKRLLSNLAHWSPLFGEVKYLPLFVFPFVKLIHFDPLLCFEIVTTIIINWCQHWFEYFPYPPVNILSMVENVLARNDQELVAFFMRSSVTSQLYAWSLLETAFSEVLSRTEWLTFWDHVLSNEPCFLVLACVSYNISFRNTIMCISDQENFEFFYHNPNPINMKSFISKTYKLLSETSNDIHLRKFFKQLTPLTKGTYNVFNEYPKFVVDYQSTQLQEIKLEEEELKREKEQLLLEKKKQEKKIIADGQSKVEEARLRKLEEMYRATIMDEEDRVAKERKRILNLKRELRLQELELLEDAKEKLKFKHTKDRQIALDRLIQDVSRRRAREECELQNVEEEIRQHYAELEAHKGQLEMEIGFRHNDFLPTVEQSNLQRQQERLKSELSKLRDEAVLRHHNQQIEITKRITIVEDLLQRVEMELAKELAERQNNLLSAKENIKILQLEANTKKLEDEVQRLLNYLAEVRLDEAQRIALTIERSRNDRTRLNEQQADIVENYLKTLQPRENPAGDDRSSSVGKRYELRPNICVDLSADEQSTSHDKKYSKQMDAVKSAMNLRRQLVNDAKKSSYRTSR